MDEPSAIGVSNSLSRMALADEYGPKRSIKKAPFRLTQD
jgi:hypothetical protein